METPLRILIVEDSPDDAEMILHELRRSGFALHWTRVQDETAFAAELARQPDIILSDFFLPQFDGLRAVKMLREQDHNIPFILISGTVGEEIAVEAMRQGATDYLLKDRIARLGPAIHRALEERRLRAERLQADQEKRQSEERARQLAESQSAILNALPAHIALLDPAGVILTVNESWRRFASLNLLPDADFGVSRNYLEVCESVQGECAEQARAVAAGIRRVLRGEAADFFMEYPCHSPTEQRWFRLIVTPLHEGRQSGVVVMHVNMTERKLAEERLLRLNQLYAMSNAVNETIARVDDLQEIYDKACRVAVQKGGLQLAWVGTVNEADLAIQIAASAGRRTDYLQLLQLSVRADLPGGQGPAGQAFRRRSIVACNDIAAASGFALRAEALQNGYRSCAVCPLEVGDRVVGLFVVYSEQGDYFQDEELKLLGALSGNLSFALDAHQRETAKRQTEAALRASEASMANAQRIAHFGSWELELEEAENYEKNPLHWSAEIYRIFGVATHRFGGTYGDFWAMIHPEDRSRFEAAQTRVLAGQGNLDFEHRIVRPDGVVRWVHEQGELQPAAEGRGRRLSGTVLDITARKQAEDERDRFFNLSLDMLCVAGFDGWLRQVNPAWTECLGWTASELTSRPMSEFILPEDHPATHRIREEIYAGVPVRGFENRYRCKAGSHRWFSWNVFPQLESRQVFAVARDVTERKETELALRESEEKFRQLAENINEAFWITDPAKNQMIYISPAYEKIWGRSCQSLYASPGAWLEAIHPDDRERVTRAAIGKQVSGMYDKIYRVVRPDGAIRWVHDRAFPILDDAGQVYRIVGTAEDVTEKRKLEEQLRQSQKMEAIGLLAGGVAHDFNNILAVIQLQTGMMRLESELTPSQREYAGEIEKAAERAANLTRQLLLFSRRQNLQPRNVDLNDLIASITKMLKRILGEDIQMQFKYASKPLLIHADPGMMDQVLMNLAVNSRDAMPRGGRLIIETSAVIFDEEAVGQFAQARAGAFACLSVSDNGGGIPPEVLPRIFEPFYTTKDVGKGTGLGLATVFGIVHQHEGWINVYSEIGRGTTMKVYLPLTSTENADTSHEDVMAVQGGNETILLVEDEAALRRSAELALVRLGYRVLEAADGAEALRVWRQHRAEVRLLLTDLVMPGGMSGKELAEQLLALQPDLKVIYISGYSADIVREDFQLEEGNNFIAKPFPSTRLAQVVRKKLDD